MFSRRLDWLAGENALAAAGHAVRLDLTVSNPTAVGLAARGPALAAALASPEAAAYAPTPRGPLAARIAVAHEYARLGATVEPARLLLTASSSESYALLIKLLCDPGDVLLVPEPSYPLFDYLARLEGVSTRAYPLRFLGEWHVDLAAVAEALLGARALIVVSPNNPTGSVLRAAELRVLADLCARQGAALIADEVFADYAFAAPADAVATVAGADLPALTFALGGLSKSCGLPQMKLGWIAAGGPGADEALARLELIADTYLSVGAPVLAALPPLLVVGAEIRAELRARIATNRAVLAGLPRELPLSWLPCEAGWSAILRVPSVMSDEAWALALLEHDGVLVQPGYFFDLRDLGATIVLSLITPPAEFAAGVAKIVARARAV